MPELPQRPAWDLVDIERYRSVWLEAHGYFSLNMAASRGCSFRCNWCAKPIWGNQYLQRKAGDIAAEMLHLKGQYPPDHVWFADDIFGFRADWVMEFATALSDGGGGVPFTIQLRADLVSPRMADALRRARCREVWIGAESGSQKILDAMNKGIRVPEIVAARRLLGAEGIRVGFFLQLGYLGEQGRRGDVPQGAGGVRQHPQPGRPVEERLVDAGAPPVADEHVGGGQDLGGPVGRQGLDRSAAGASSSPAPARRARCSGRKA